MTCWIDEHDQIDRDAASRDLIPQAVFRAEHSIDYRTVMRNTAPLAKGIDEIRQHNVRYQGLRDRSMHVCTPYLFDVEKRGSGTVLGR
jgi:hypothetical protein